MSAYYHSWVKLFFRQMSLATLAQLDIGEKRFEDFPHKGLGGLDSIIRLDVGVETNNHFPLSPPKVVVGEFHNQAAIGV